MSVYIYIHISLKRTSLLMFQQLCHLSASTECHTALPSICWKYNLTSGFLKLNSLASYTSKTIPKPKAIIGNHEMSNQPDNQSVTE